MWKGYSWLPSHYHSHWFWVLLHLRFFSVFFSGKPKKNKTTAAVSTATTIPSIRLYLSVCVSVCRIEFCSVTNHSKCCIRCMRIRLPHSVPHSFSSIKHLEIRTVVKKNCLYIFTLTWTQQPRQIEFFFPSLLSLSQNKNIDLNTMDNGIMLEINLAICKSTFSI